MVNTYLSNANRFVVHTFGTAYSVRTALRNKGSFRVLKCTGSFIGPEPLGFLMHETAGINSYQGISMGNINRECQ